jgi:hypothetical protein
MSGKTSLIPSPRRKEKRHTRPYGGLRSDLVPLAQLLQINPVLLGDLPQRIPAMDLMFSGRAGVEDLHPGEV